MIYNQAELFAILQDIMSHPENEIVEVKEARTQYNFNDIGKYFSAFSNEANLHGKQDAWLIFGIADDMSIVGSHYRKGEKELHNLKKEIKDHTNQGLSFIEIYVHYSYRIDSIGR